MSEYANEYNFILKSMRTTCKNLYHKYGYILSGSPLLIDEIKEYNNNYPNDNDCIDGLSLVKKHDQLIILISKNQNILNSFIDTVR